MSSSADHHDPDEGICIYLDGLSGRLHGNPQTAQNDREIRNWLRGNGYDVIEIVATDLHDREAMTRHFRKLAGYLRNDALREKVRTETSWFDGEGLIDAARRFTLKFIQPRESERYVSCVPFVPLKAAAGAFSDPQTVEDGGWDWVEIQAHRKLRPGMFVAQVVGHSMEPAIPDGSYCLFSSPVVGSRQGRTVLVQLRDESDPETGERYTVKHFQIKGRRGVTTGKVKQSGTRTYVQVQFGPHEKSFIFVEDAERIDLTKPGVGDLLRANKFGHRGDLARVLTFHKISSRLANVFYAMQTSRTDFYAYQFKPVYKFIESANGRILIADEVGCYKEASKRAVEQLAPQVRVEQLPVPKDMNMQGLPPSVFHRFAVAYGLSFNEVNLPVFNLPHQVTPDRPRSVRGKPNNPTPDVG